MGMCGSARPCHTLPILRPLAWQLAGGGPHPCACASSRCRDALAGCEQLRNVGNVERCGWLWPRAMGNVGRRGRLRGQPFKPPPRKFGSNAIVNHIGIRVILFSRHGLSMVYTSKWW